MWTQDNPRAIVIVGPMNCQAVAPRRLAVGPLRDAEATDIAYNDADALEALFSACPREQWGAAAQAAMSMKEQGKG